MPDDEQNPAVRPPQSGQSNDSLEGHELSSSDPLTTANNDTAPASTPAPPKKPSLISRLRGRMNIYFLVFVLVVLAAGIVIVVTFRSNKSTSKTTTAGSLTDQQLSELKGNTTLVGDAKQTLDVQSNSIFEGQVLIRNDLNVAGAIKVGGGLSLSSITISGGGNFGQLGVNGGLNVGGDTILQGSLTVQKNLSVGGGASFGSLSVSQLSVTSLSLKGDVTVSRHITSSGGVPGRTNGTALGSGGTASVSGGDTSGSVTINTGGSPPAGCFVTINFSQSFNTIPHVVISPSNSSAATIQYYTNRTTTGFSICTANVPAASTTYTYDYVAFD